MKVPKETAASEWERHKVVIAATVAAIAGPAGTILDIKPARNAPACPWTRQGRRVAVQTASNLANRRGVGRTFPDRGVNR